jgi:hypothetical protein
LVAGGAAPPPHGVVADRENDGPILQRPVATDDRSTIGATVHFYELQEGDGDTFFDVMLFREEEMASEEFFTVVQSIRRRIQDTYQTDSLIEAIALELEQDYDFVFVSDDRLTAAVNVSKNEEDNFLADLEPDELDTEDVDYRAVYADFEPMDGPPN